MFPNLRLILVPRPFFHFLPLILCHSLHPKSFSLLLPTKETNVKITSLRGEKTRKNKLSSEYWIDMEQILF